MNQANAKNEIAAMFQAMGLLLTSLEDIPKAELSDDAEYGFSLNGNLVSLEKYPEGNSWLVYYVEYSPGGREVPPDCEMVEVISTNSLEQAVLAASNVILQDRLEGYDDNKLVEELAQAEEYAKEYWEHPEKF